MNIGDKVLLFYDGRPLKPAIEQGMGEVIKITPSGFLRIKGKTAGYDRNELFDPETGMARGWNTLRFEEFPEYLQLKQEVKANGQDN